MLKVRNKPCIFRAMAIIFAMALSWLSPWLNPLLGSGIVSGFCPEMKAESKDLTVSIITCYPGPEIYELCGHSAIRIRGEKIDSVWNFGLFDFNEPNFVYRFVKGETDYMAGGYPFRYFLPEYMERGSKVVEQDLNLNQEEAEKMLAFLRYISLPENRRYRYNYVKDNCATRILNSMDSVSGEKIIYPDSVAFGSFRNEMRAYHKNYPWYQFGIDLALGSGLDYRLNSREEMFVPIEMMEKIDRAHFADGRDLVRSKRVLNEGRENAILPPTPWWGSPLFIACLVFIIVLVVCAWDYRRGGLNRPFYFIWYFLLGLAGWLVFFLVFISEHEATSPNILILWLNPLQWLMCIGVLSRRLRFLSIFTSWYDIVVLLMLLIVWPFQKQSGNIAFFPLMAATFLSSLAYAIIARKKSYIIDNDSGKRKGRKKLQKSPAGNRKKKTVKKR